jgi:undecaprenyl-phosphate 4-deoxy-4-formamido-L-arabinose transferase
MPEQARREVADSFACESVGVPFMLNISVVVPVYRSEDCLPALGAAVDQVMRTAGLSYELLLVNDASPDNSWTVIRDLAQKNPAVKGLSHRRNFGQDNAIMTGLRHATGAAVVIMDDDLQHAPEDIPRLYAELARSGADVVYAHFRKIKQARWKNLGSWFNGKVAEWLMDKPSHIYLSPFKIVRREVVELVTSFDGPYPYIDSLLFQVTNRFSFIEAEHQKRFIGSSTYTLPKSLQVWSRLAVSFSIKPLRLVTWMGILTFVFGSLGAVLVVVDRVMNADQFSGEAAGWASLMVTVLVLAGVQMLALGIIGEYVGRSHVNIHRKPQAIVAETVSIEPIGP